jgi:membrane-associated phospholipid phosphatase
VTASVLMVLAAATGRAQAARDSTPPPLRWPAVFIAAGLVGSASLLDATVARDIRDHPSADRRSTADQLARFGTVSVIGPTVVTLAITGLVAHEPKLTGLAVNTAKSMAVATIAVQALKLTAGRTRPRDDRDAGADDFSPFSGNASFPSGHATAAFAFATTLGDAIDRPWARVGLFALAGGTAWARVAQEAHWVSDVVAGAAVGVASAKFATGRRTIFGLRAPRLGVGPTGLSVSWSELPWKDAHH